MTDLRVGIIGVNAERGWAREAHVPAVRAVPGLTLTAIANRSDEAARSAADALGVPQAFGDPAALIADPGIDIVTVASPVPTHHELIRAALQAGKHVVTEWPVTTSVEQTAELAALAATAGRRTAVGLQARLDPAVTKAGELIDGGEIGRVLSASVVSTTAAFGAEIPPEAMYLEDPQAGMNLPTIQFAHTLDIVQRLLGGFASLDARFTVRFPRVRVIGGDSLRRTVADHVLVQGEVDGGAAVGIEVSGGRPDGLTPFRAEIVGERRTLTMTGGAPRGFQSGRLARAVDGRPVAVDDGLVEASAADGVVNVAHVYAALRDEIGGEGSRAPSFAHAAGLARLVADVQAAARDERRNTLA